MIAMVTLCGGIMKRYKYIVKVTPLSSVPDRYYLEYFDTEQKAKDFIGFILTTADYAVMIDSD